MPEVCVPLQVVHVAGYAYSVTPLFVPGVAFSTFNSPIIPTQPSVHQIFPLGSTLIKCGVRPPGKLVRILYSFKVPPLVYSPINATAELFSVNQILFEASTTIP